MGTITTEDGSTIYFKDWGAGPVVTFSHGWPLSADAWDAQMLFLAKRGFRCIAHDRRGHGRSSQPWNGNDMDTYADDLAELLDQLNVQDAVMVGHSTGGGEVVRYIGRHGAARVKKAVLISAVPPVMLKSESNPDGTPMEVFDGLRAGVAGDRSQLWKDLSMPFYGFNKPEAKVSEGLRDSFWLQGMAMSVVGAYECVKAFSETDFHEDLKKLDLPLLVMHGDADQIVPFGNAGALTAAIVKGALLKVYAGAPHGMCQTIPDTINTDLLAFLQS